MHWNWRGKITLLFMLVMAITGCASTPPQYVAHQRQVQAEQDKDRRKHDQEMTEAVMAETTKQAAIMFNAGYPFAQRQPVQESAGKEDIELRFPLIENLLKACKEGCDGSKCEPIPDDYCRKAEAEMERIKAEHKENLKTENSSPSPPQSPVAPGGVVIIANGATFTGNNFFAPGATAGGNKIPPKKVAARPPIPLPKSNLQTFFDGIFGLSSEIVRAGKDLVPQVAPWVAAGYLGAAGIEKKSNYVQDSSLYGRDNNAGRLQYKYSMSEGVAE